MKLGLIGASNILERILPAIFSVEGIEVRGVASASAHGEAFALRQEIPFLGSHAELFAQDDIDAVYISTLNTQHVECIEMALKAGKHVLCEKPLVLRESDAVRLFALASEKKLILLEGFMYRFHPQVIEFKRIVKTGALGALKCLRLNYGFISGNPDGARAMKKYGGGAIADLGCYLIDFMNSLIDEEPSKIQKIYSNETSERGETDYTVLIEYPSGARVEMSGSKSVPSLNLWEAVCERGSVAARRFNPLEIAETELYLVNKDSAVATWVIASEGAGLEQFAHEFASFRDSVDRGAKAFITADESIRNARVLEFLLK